MSKDAIPHNVPTERRLAIQWIQEGVSTPEAARRLKVDATTVRRWRRAFDAGGWIKLIPGKHPGRPPKLTAAQKAELVDILCAGPILAGYETDLWTCRRVAEVITDRFGVDHHPDHLGRLLKTLGFTHQKPQRRAIERDEEAIGSWVKNDWPRIKKKRPKTRRTSSSSMSAAT